MAPLSRLPRPLKRPLGVLAVSLGLTAFLFYAELYLPPEALGEGGYVAYRALYWLVLPLRALFFHFIPDIDTRHHLAPAHYWLTTLTMPFYLGAIGWALRRTLAPLWHRLRRLKSAPAAETAPKCAQFPAAASPTELASAHRVQEELLAGGLERRLPRREFLAGAAVGVAGLATGSVSMIDPVRLQVIDYTIYLRDLPAALDGVRLVHLTDTHFGPFVSMGYLERAFEKANRLGGDLIVLTGDYIHKTPRSLEPGIRVLGQLKARLGVAAVLGNHDHWEGTEHCKDVFRQIRIPLIDNDRLFLTPEGLSKEPVPGRSLCLAGVGDLWEDEVCYERAVGGVEPEVPRVVLAHNPDVAEMIQPGTRVDLILSGHTHGGQVRLPLVGVPFSVTNYGKKYLGGICQGPECPVIVGRGVGQSGVPLRLGVPPEIGVITLRRGG